MNTHFSSRRGSALLIVLGMLAFMIVSAVAFSAFMRYSRMPSSFLRRTAASRQLVKAALARAIDEVDAAIGNNPHPGVGVAETRYPRDPEKGDLERRNIWVHRVFFGTNDCYSVGNSGNENGDWGNTVSPLTLEGLAYIPAPLVDDVRYLSRYTPTAAWKSLAFDAGRYVYCAVDISDYFDVNRMLANASRSSAANRRVTLSYIFDGEGSGLSEKWDKWMENFRDYDEDSGKFSWESKAPLVSVADLNLAMENKTFGTIRSHFYNYVTANRKDFYTSGSSDEELERIGNMAFVTEGLFPPEEDPDNDKIYDLSDSKWQPFDIDPGQGDTDPFKLSDLLMGSVHRNPKEMGWHTRLSGAGLAALYDYLDPNHVPVSLALPTLERVPMIVGLEPSFDGKLSVSRDLEYNKYNGGEDGNGDPGQLPPEEGSTRQVEQTVRYWLDSQKLNLSAGALNAIMVYPFSKKVDYTDSFTLDGRLSLFFSAPGVDMSLRTDNPAKNSEILHLASKEKCGVGIDGNGMMNIALQGGISLNGSKDIKNPTDAVKDITLPFASAGAENINSALNGDSALLRVTYRWTQIAAMVQGTGGVKKLGWKNKFSEVLSGSVTPDSQTYATDLCIVNANGTRSGSPGDLAGWVNSGKTINLNVAVWLRVKDKSGNVVDMVPACLQDDDIQKNLNDEPLAHIAGEWGACFPLMRFDTAGQGSNTGINLSLDNLEKLANNDEPGDNITIWPKSALVADPRFNHAPENWFAHDGALSSSVWLNPENSQTGGDIFMSVSDAGYLQSKYELAMLPALTDDLYFDVKGGKDSGSSQGNMPPVTSYSGRSIPAARSQTAQNSKMWLTYEPWGADRDAFEDNMKNWISGRAGVRVNPYSDSTNVIMAAFANTPIDWSHASSNIVSQSGSKDYYSMKADEFNKNYAFNDDSPYALAYEDLESVAGKFMNKVREFNGDWKKAWNEMDWYSGDLCGLTLGNSDKLWEVDKKFLYGFWRESLAARQQLFLIFVRAEPAMMGGGGMGQIPPQLGGRAVAVVWRNPDPVQKDGETVPPHQTRVLFYRQLD